ncbi:MAG: hypothetical protein ABIN55_00005, partial [Aeromicrobium sp.]
MTVAPPQFSPDGHWFWTGEEWVPAPPPAASATTSEPVPTSAQTVAGPRESDAAWPSATGVQGSSIKTDVVARAVALSRARPRTTAGVGVVVVLAAV